MDLEAGFRKIVEDGTEFCPPGNPARASERHVDAASTHMKPVRDVLVHPYAS